jgi:transposase
MPRYIGLDLHKAYVVGCEWQPDAEASHQETHFRYPTTPEGWSRLWAHLGGDAIVAIEVTGNAFEVYDTWLPHAREVVVANPLEMRRLGSGKHTDKGDAARLAKMLAMGVLPTVWVPPPSVRAVRRLLAGRERLLSMRTAAINQLKAIGRRHGLVWGRWDPHDPRLATLTQTVEADEAVLGEAARRQVAALDTSLRDVEGEILGRLKDDPAFRHLLTIPGVGPITAATIWAAIGDPRRFRTAKPGARYAGLDPPGMPSGERDQRGRISQKGSRQLRTVLVEAAHVVSRHDAGPLGTWYARVAPAKGRNKSTIALARKLLVLAWKLMLNGEDYRDVKPDRLQRKLTQIEKQVAQRRDAEPLGAERAERPHPRPRAAPRRPLKRRRTAS